MAAFHSPACFVGLCLGDNLKFEDAGGRGSILSQKRSFGTSMFFKQVTADGLYNLVSSDKTGPKETPVGE